MWTWGHQPLLPSCWGLGSQGRQVAPQCKQKHIEIMGKENR